MREREREVVWAELKFVVKTASVIQLGPNLCDAQGTLNPQEDFASSEVDGNCNLFVCFLLF